MNWQTRLTLCYLTIAIIAVAGCRTRRVFYHQADRDAYYLLHEKSDCTPWSLPEDFSAETDPASRHYRPDSLVRPTLPSPVTPLYSYDLGAILMNKRMETDPPPKNESPEIENPVEQLRGIPISPEAWKAIPQSCLKRMLDFETIREEAEYTSTEFEQPIQLERDTSIPSLNLRDIVDIAIVNSREFQTQKETLYLVALQLAQERFEYQYQFSPGGVRTGVFYDHQRFLGITQDGLSIPSAVGTQKRLLMTGGDFFARFANNIFLTFNGPSGFAADVSSELLFELAQPLVQTDIRFESLTQAERNLVYAARDFARFRKQFFVQFASDYYSLIANFRRIEIQSQNYFSLAREFKRAEAEYLTGTVPRFQLDQVEQNLLEGRGTLISVCVGVERDLDALKLSLGIPVETPINVDLAELNELTRLDQVTVSADSINRILLRLKTFVAKPERIDLSNAAAVMLERVIETAAIDPGSFDAEKVARYRSDRLSFLIDYARLNADEIYANLQEEVNSEIPSDVVIFRRSQAHSESLSNLIVQQINYARERNRGKDQSEIDAFDRRRDEQLAAIDGLDLEFQEIVQNRGLAELPNLVRASNDLRKQFTGLVERLDRFNEMTVETDVEKDLRRMVDEVQRLITEIEPALTSKLAGLTPIDIDEDEAMITALVLRFDMMNERGLLADDWRQIKLAADNLESFIDLNASQRFNSDPLNNQPFDFSFDNSRTALSLSVDVPANRFAQRNAFRSSLIRYQQALRSMNLLEDNIKRAIRNDLRNLNLDRQQYLIAVARAALAYERVVSTSIQFGLGTDGIAARDFLEAQDAYTDSLIDVAVIHIQYIRNRTQLFLDLELLTVDESGFWEDIRNESVKPEPHFAIPTWGQPVFGELPRVNYSREIRQIMNISPEFDLGLEGFESWVPEVGKEGCPEEGIEVISPDVSPATEGAGDGTDRSPPETVSSRRGPEPPDSR